MSDAAASRAHLSSDHVQVRDEAVWPKSVLEQIGEAVMQYGLAIIFLWVGAMKFTDYEAAGIAPFVMNSPLVSWWHTLLGIGGTAIMLGVVEIVIGLLLFTRPFFPRLSAIGGAMATITFLITLTFMFTTPGVGEPRAGGFPALSAMPGQFLAKDLALLGISIWVLGSSLAAARRRRGVQA